MNATIEYLIKSYENSLNPEELKIFYGEYVEGLENVLKDKLIEPGLNEDEITQLKNELVVLGNEKTRLIGEAVARTGNCYNVEKLIQTHRVIKRELSLEESPAEVFTGFGDDREKYLSEVPEELHKVTRGKQGFVKQNLEINNEAEQKRRRKEEEKEVEDAFK